jgi:hypothetical protein
VVQEFKMIALLVILEAAGSEQEESLHLSEVAFLLPNSSLVFSYLARQIEVVY